MPPSAKIVAITAPTAPATMCATSPIRPFGRNSPVASVSSLPSRAAIAAPSMPTQSVRFDANGADPGNRRRRRIARDDLGERQQHDARRARALARRFSACRDADERAHASTCLWSSGTRPAPDGHVVDVGRHHAAAHRRDQLGRRRRGIPPRPSRSSVDHLEPACLSSPRPTRRPAPALRRGRVFSSACAAAVTLGLIFGADLVPGAVGDDHRADERRDAEVEHVLRVAEDLERRAPGTAGSAPCRSGRSQLQLRRDVGRQERHRVKAVRHVPLHHLVVALAREELRRLHVGERARSASSRRPGPSRRCPSRAGGSPWLAAAARGSASASSRRRLPPRRSRRRTASRRR